MTNTFEKPLNLRHCGDLALLLRESLASAGFNQSKLIQLIRSSGSAVGGSDWTLAMRRTAAPGPFNTLFRLFVLGQDVVTESARAALGDSSLDQSIQAGLLRSQDGQVSSEAKLLPFNDIWVLGDFRSDVTGRTIQTDHVLGAGAASATLAGLTSRRPVESVLDLGCGSGVQSFVASRHAQRVVATDINHRALNFAVFGAALNGYNNIEFRHGSMFEPVEGETFDLVVSNPPFVISPESRFAFRDGGMGGDMISEQLIRNVPAYLRDEGRAVFLFNWHHRDEEDWTMRPAQWLSSKTSDAWLIRFHSEDPLTYAAQWLRPTESTDQLQYGRLLDEWMAYYERIGAGRVSAGAVIIQKRLHHSHWSRYDTVPEGRHVGDCGPQIDRIIDAENFLQSIDSDDRLLDVPFCVADDHRLEHILVLENGQWAIQTQNLRQTKGFTFSGQIDPLIAQLLAGCNGHRPLRDLVNELTQQVDEPQDKVVATCLTIVKKLMRSGLLYQVQTDASDR